MSNDSGVLVYKLDEEEFYHVSDLSIIQVFIFLLENPLEFSEPSSMASLRQ
jgi:hypothetical protein